MAVSPGTYNFVLQRRSDHSFDLQFKDSNNAAIDLTGFTVYAQAWNQGRGKNTLILRLLTQTEQTVRSS